MNWPAVIIIGVICGFVCEYLGNNKGQSGCFLYGLLFGVFGVIIVLCLKDKSQEKKMNNNTQDNKFEKLEQLQRLKESGAITQNEFEMEKYKLLK